jgi:hypothetical protein
VKCYNDNSMRLRSCIRNINKHITPNLCFYIQWDLRGRVGNSGVSGARNVNELFFLLGWDVDVFDQKRVRTHNTKLVCFLHLVGSVGHVVHSGASGV